MKSYNSKASAAKVHKSGAAAGAVALCVVTAALIGVSGLMGRRAQMSRVAAPAEGVSYAVTEAAANGSGSTDETVEAPESIEWKKASISEYEIAEVSAKKPEDTEKEPVVTEIEEKDMTADEAANIRKKPSKSAEVIGRVSEGDMVVAVGETEDGWLKVKFGAKTGFVVGDSFSEVPEKAEEPVVEEPAVYYGTISYTETEYEMLCYVIQSEVGNCSESSKIAVSNVVINRVKSPAFPNSIEGVLTAQDQFTAVWNYYGGYNPPTQNTRDCVRRALNGEEITGGATYYYAPAYCGGSSASWFESLQFCAAIDGQRFFKNW